MFTGTGQIRIELPQDGSGTAACVTGVSGTGKLVPCNTLVETGCGTIDYLSPIQPSAEPDMCILA